MPIIYLHGVNTREFSHFEPVQEYLRRIVASSIAKDPENVSIRAANWFPLCDPPKWGGISRPETFLGQGSATERIEALDAILLKAPRTGVASTLTSGQSAQGSQIIRLDPLSEDDLSDLIALSAWSDSDSTRDRARIGVAADRLGRDPQVRAKLKDAKDLEAQLEVISQAIQADVELQGQLVGHGGWDFLRSMKDRVGESLSRLVSSPAAVGSVVAAELRPSLNAFVTRFLGDLLFYMTRRGSPTAPGPIPSVLIDELKLAQTNQAERDGEPLVLLTHSMGGQIAYDVLSSFLPAAGSDIKVDFWCATASQVGFFEELNMFLASSNAFSKAKGKHTPVPTSHLGSWWNVWDPNDILSFTTAGIFADGIVDERYWSGRSLAAAHGGYLERPSFYRQFADKLKAAYPSRGK